MILGYPLLPNRKNSCACNHSRFPHCSHIPHMVIPSSVSLLVSHIPRLLSFMHAVPVKFIPSPISRVSHHPGVQSPDYQVPRVSRPSSIPSLEYLIPRVSHPSSIPSLKYPVPQLSHPSRVPSFECLLSCVFHHLCLLSLKRPSLDYISLAVI